MRGTVGLWVALAALACSVQAKALLQPAEPPSYEAALSNEEIVKLTQAGLGTVTIVAKIKEAPSESFDVSTNGLLELKKHKVADAVMRAILDRVASRSAAAHAKPPGPEVEAPPPAAPEASSQDQLPEVVARVNGAEIRKDELLKTAEQVRKQTPGAPASAALYRRVLENLVNRNLMIQEAVAAGITATSAETDQQVAELKARFPSPEKYQEELKAEGLTETELVQRARDAFIVRKLIETRIAADVRITDAEEKSFYNQNRAQLKGSEGRVLSFAAAKDRIDAILKEKAQTAKVQEHLKELRAKSRIEIFV